jgi:hypothetical protein
MSFALSEVNEYEEFMAEDVRFVLSQSSSFLEPMPEIEGLLAFGVGGVDVAAGREVIESNPLALLPG